MKIIKIILKTLGREEKKVLGRWKIEICDKEINKKIDLSNEDHCGTCGEYILNKVTINENMKKIDHFTIKK